MRRQYAGGAQPTTLLSGIGPTDVTLTALNVATWPDGSVGPFTAVLDEGLSNEEKVLVNTRTGNVFNNITRGYDGTAAVSHSSNATLAHCFTATDADEANSHVNATTTVHGVTGALASATSVSTVQTQVTAQAGAITALQARPSFVSGKVTSADAPSGLRIVFPGSGYSLTSTTVGTWITGANGLEVPAPGLYDVKAASSYSSGVPTNTSIGVAKNGSTTDWLIEQRASCQYLSVAGTVECAAGDFLSTVVEQISGSDQTVTVTFAAYRVSP